MALSIEESKRKYMHYIAVARDLAKQLEAYGYKVETKDDIEIEATYMITLDSKRIARVTWGVPYYLEFEPFVNMSEKGFSEDYVRNYDDWQEFMLDIQKSLELYARNRAA